MGQGIRDIEHARVRPTRRQRLEGLRGLGLAMQGRFGRIGKALQLIHRAYDQTPDVARLAEAAGMSTPSFHSHFRAVTCPSPMQYLKSTRLHQARLLMVREGMMAAACHAVGFGSTLQFSREFKRLFGLTPASEARRMRESFALPPRQPHAVYVSSH